MVFCNSLFCFDVAVIIDFPTAIPSIFTLFSSELTIFTEFSFPDVHSTALSDFIVLLSPFFIFNDSAGVNTGLSLSGSGVGCSPESVTFTAIVLLPPSEVNTTLVSPSEFPFITPSFTDAISSLSDDQLYLPILSAFFIVTVS